MPTSLSKTLIQAMVRKAVPNRTISSVEALPGGLINTNLHIHFDNSDSVVLRIYRDGATACRKESALHRLVREKVPVAEIIHSQPDGIDGSDSFSILEYVDELTFHQLKQTNQREAMAEASRSAGKTLAAIGSYNFLKPGRILVDAESDELQIGESFISEDYQVPDLLDSFLESSVLQQRIDKTLVSKVRRLVHDSAPALLQMTSDHSLVHCDFGNRNLLVNNKSGGWEVAVVLDWELATSGSPLLDVGHFLRYDYQTQSREPYFSTAFVENGGHLPYDWQRIVRVLDLTGLVECLTHEKLPTDVEAEIRELIEATLKESRV